MKKVEYKMEMSLATKIMTIVSKLAAVAVVAVLAVTLVTGCNEKSGHGNLSSGTGKSSTPAGETVGRLNPPAWFVGEWEKTSGTNQQSENIKVTVNNVVVSSGKLDFSWQINNVGLEITEITGENHYRLEYTIDGILFSYDFTLKEDGSMILMLFDAPVGKSTYTKK